MMRILTLAAAAFAMVLPAKASEPEAEAFVVDLVTELRANAESDGEQSPAVLATLEENLATEAIGKFLLAGEAADNATEDQLSRYNELFPRYIAAAFASEIGQLTAREIEVKGSLERRPGDIIVQSILLDSSGVKRASIDWRVRETGDAYKLLDVLVERISPLITRRQRFSGRIRDDGLDGLLAYMEEVIEEGGEEEAR